MNNHHPTPKSPSHKTTLLSLSLITLLSNATYSTIAPILPLEIDAHSISQRWLSVIFLAYPIGYCVASPLFARWFEVLGTVNVMIGGLGMVGALFLVESCLFDVPSLIYERYDTKEADSKLLIVLLTMGQFALGASMSSITTGYYSLATLLFVDVESAMSCIESAVGMGFILGPVLGSMLYDALGFRWAYRGVSFVVLVMAFATWRFLRKYLVCKRLLREEGYESDVFEMEAQVPLVKSFSKGRQQDIENSQEATNSRRSKTSKMSCDSESEIDIWQLEAQDTTQQNIKQSNNLKPNPTTLTLLKTPKITTAALSITWISASWFFLEPILAKRLIHFHLQKREIGLMFALSNMVYVPTAFCLQYLPKWMEKHLVIALSILATPLAVLLVGNDSFALMRTGILLLGFFPTPVWIFLLPSLQEDASALFSSDQKRCVNDLTAGLYNLFITLGQIVGYVIGPLVTQSYGVVMTTRIVAGLIFVQAIVYCVGVGMFGGRMVRWQRKRKRKGRYFVRYI